MADGEDRRPERRVVTDAVHHDRPGARAEGNDGSELGIRDDDDAERGRAREIDTARAVEVRAVDGDDRARPAARGEEATDARDRVVRERQARADREALVHGDRSEPGAEGHLRVDGAIVDDGEGW